MNEQVIAIYCFVDDFLNKTRFKDESKKKIKDSEILTTAFVAGIYFGGNMVKACNYIKTHQGVNMIDKSGFNRRLHGLTNILNDIFFSLGNVFKSLNIKSSYIIDSFPVKVCHNIRIPNCKILKGEKYRGKCVSKREYFYVFKVQLIITYDGLPVEYFIVAGSFSDITAFKSMNISLPGGSELYADSAYTDYSLEDDYREIEKINLCVCRKSNSRRKDSPWLRELKIQMRKRIETVFSCISNFIPKKIHAVTAEGFLLKIILFLLSYSVTKALNI